MKIREINIGEDYSISIFNPNYDSTTMFVSEMGDLLQLDVETLVESCDALGDNSFLLFKTNDFIGCIGRSFTICNGGFQPIDDGVLIIKKKNLIGFHIQNIKPAKGSGYTFISIRYVEDRGREIFSFEARGTRNSDEKLEKFKTTSLLEIMQFWELDVPISQWNGYDC